MDVEEWWNSGSGQKLIRSGHFLAEEPPSAGV